jgi:type III secretion system FlhB-like substrate exporter
MMIARRTSHNHLHIQEKTLIFPTIVKKSITSIVRTEMYSTVVEIVKELTQVHDVVAADGTIIHNNICEITCKPSIL